MSTSPRDFVLTLESQRWRVDQIRENSPRLATGFGSYTTTGFGEFTMPTPVRFGCEFIDRPHFAAGFSLADGQELVDTRYPRGICFVSDWWINGRGNYLGAYLSFCVDTISPVVTSVAPDPNYKLIFDVTFQGVAMKQLPEWLLDR